MYPGSETKGSLTVGDADSRITPAGWWLRKTKLDELPQLINVLTGDMSMVGPRPEVRRYVNHYTQAQLAVLSVKPGITDHASIYFRNESALLAQQHDPETFYIREILPVKIGLNMAYIKNNNIYDYFLIIFKTLLLLFLPSQLKPIIHLKPKPHPDE